MVLAVDLLVVSSVWGMVHTGSFEIRGPEI